VDEVFGEVEPGGDGSHSVPSLAGLDSVPVGGGRFLGRVRVEAERSVAAAVEAGLVDRERDAGAVAALMLVADQLDDPDFPLRGGRVDNVSLPAFLRYSEALGLTPASASAKQSRGRRSAY
jgi:hypothetical protein